jgi:hypothetical protein
LIALILYIKLVGAVVIPLVFVVFLGLAEAEGSEVVFGDGLGTKRVSVLWETWGFLGELHCLGFAIIVKFNNIFSYKFW